MTEPTHRPRPTPDGSARAQAEPPTPGRAVVVPRSAVPGGGPRPRTEVEVAQVVAAAGNAVVTAARVGWKLGRSSWQIARRLPGGPTFERLRSAAVDEARRLLQVPQAPSAPVHRTPFPEQRAVDYLAHSEPGEAPLRSAMSELLERSVDATRTDSREYLYGTIISQLVPDEARILAALADGSRFAASDVVQRPRRGAPRVLLANASAIGRQAGLTTPDNVPTYLSRLQHFGLVEFGPPDATLDVQYDILATDATVQHVHNAVDPRKRHTVRIVRKTLAMSAFGGEFWAATDPSRAPQDPL